MKNRSDISDLLLIKYLKGEAKGDELHRVADWLEESDQNIRELEKLKVIWRSSASLNDFETIDLTTNWQVIQHRLQKQKQTSVVWWKYAAAILVLAVASWLVLKPAPVEMLVYKAATVGDELNLPDGSLVTLNKGAMLSYPAVFDKDSREVRLEGEAFFDVKHDPLRPFSVMAADTKTEVLGTTFNISQGPGDFLQLSLYTGRVAFSKGDRREVLIPGQQIVVDIDGSIQKSSSAIDNAISWKTRKLIFDNTAMHDVVEDIEALYGVEIEIEDPSFANCPITTTFQNESIEEVLETIQLLFNIEIKFNGQEYRLIGKGC